MAHVLTINMQNMCCTHRVMEAPTNTVRTIAPGEKYYDYRKQIKEDKRPLFSLDRVASDYRYKDCYSGDIVKSCNEITRRDVKYDTNGVWLERAHIQFDMVNGNHHVVYFNSNKDFQNFCNKMLANVISIEILMIDDYNVESARFIQRLSTGETYIGNFVTEFAAKK